MNHLLAPAHLGLGFRVCLCMKTICLHRFSFRFRFSTCRQAAACGIGGVTEIGKEHLRMGRQAQEPSEHSPADRRAFRFRV
jgi:hypothetical protein